MTDLDIASCAQPHATTAVVYNHSIHYQLARVCFIGQALPPASAAGIRSQPVAVALALLHQTREDLLQVMIDGGLL